MTARSCYPTCPPPPVRVPHTTPHPTHPIAHQAVQAGHLAFTGVDVMLLVAIAIGLIAAGIAVRTIANHT